MRRLIEEASVVFKGLDCGDKFEVLKTRDGQLTLGGKYSRDLVEFYAKLNDGVVVFEFGEELPEDKQLKVGDYAKVTKARSTQSINNGDIIQITEDNRVSIYGYTYRGITLIGEDAGVFAPEQLLRVSDEEVKQARVSARWAAIGRKPGEFKKGDIVRVTWSNGHNVGDIGEIMFADGSDRPSVRVGGFSQYDRVELITPVEARFDR